MTKDPLSIEVLTLPKNANRWNLVVEFLQLRRDVFIKKKQWSLSEGEQLEYEQYDGIGAAHYVVAHRGVEVVGGARLIRCDTIIGNSRFPYSYMINDAFLGRIDIPEEICAGPPPTTGDTWELTRMISTERTPATHAALLDGAHKFIKSEGGRFCIFLGPPAFVRMGRRLGYNLERLGVVSGDETGRFLVMKFDLQDYQK